MKHLMTLAALFVSSLAMAQMPTFPWNPDGNGDGLIGSSDLIELLTVYGQEFQNAIVSENQESAAIYMGLQKSFDCAYTCKNLPGKWTLPDASDVRGVLSLFADTVAAGTNLDMWLAYEDPYIRPEDQEFLCPYMDAYTTTSTNDLIINRIKMAHSGYSSINCFCLIKQLPRVEYNTCNVINDPSCGDSLVGDGWYPMGGVSDSGTQAFWRFAQ